MTIKERMEKNHSEYKEAIKHRIELICENFYNDPAHIATESHALAIGDAIREIEGWEILQIKARNEIPYANPIEADREHKNVMNLLAVIKSKLIKKARPLALRATKDAGK